VVDAHTSSAVPGIDGLITASVEVCLGVYVADCCPVYLVDPERRVIGLLHSGRKGSQLGIAAAAIEQMRERFQCDPAKIIVQLGPCIRPPHYEVDFVRQIVGQCEEVGVRQIYDCGTCTATHPDRYYSYRLERGKDRPDAGAAGVKSGSGDQLSSIHALRKYKPVFMKRVFDPHSPELIGSSSTGFARARS